MKEGIHPEYKETTITCVCGNVIKTRSTKQDIKVEICSQCHPFMTGKQKIMDTAGRVERFKRKYAGKEKRRRNPRNAHPCFPTGVPAAASAGMRDSLPLTFRNGAGACGCRDHLFRNVTSPPIPAFGPVMHSRRVGVCRVAPPASVAPGG